MPRTPNRIGLVGIQQDPADFSKVDWADLDDIEGFVACLQSAGLWYDDMCVRVIRVALINGHPLTDVLLACAGEVVV